MRETLTGFWMRVIEPIEAVALFIGAALHLGVSVGGVNEPRVIGASAVESVIGAGLALGAYVYYKRRESWPVVMVGAQMLAMAGVLLGIAAIQFGDGVSTLGNDIFHRVLLVTLGIGLVLASLAGGVLNNRDEARHTAA